MPDILHDFNWVESVRLLHRKFGSDSLHLKVLEFLRKPDCKRVLIACSGGADSVFMLCQLWARAAPLGIQLTVAHYNHRWRGEDADLDAKFVEEMALQLKCPFVKEARSEGKSITTETDARSLRIRFLRAMARVHDCQCIAFGHQQDDILETQLQRLARGSGTEGLAAPRPVHSFENHPTHIRPLLHLSASTIRAALQKSLIVWREDASNKNTGIPRNALRHSVIPSLQNALQRDVSRGAARSRALLEEDVVALEQLAREAFPEAFEPGEFLKTAALRNAPRALSRRALSAWLNAHKLIASLSAAAIDQLINAIYSGQKKNRLSAGAFFIEFDTTTIRIESAESPDIMLEPCSLRVGESVALSTEAVLETEVVTVDEALLRRLQMGLIDSACEAYITLPLEQVFQVRARRPGDSLRPLGAPGTKKLKDWLIDRRIPIRERNRLPLVITDSGAIVWVPGLPPADIMKINAATKMALKLTYKTRKTTLIR